MIINPSNFTKIYNSSVNYGPAATISSNLSLYDSATLANNMSSGWYSQYATYYLSENLIGAYAGYIFDEEYFVDSVTFYIGRYSGQNNNLLATVQKYVNGEWVDVEDMVVATNIPYPNNTFTVTINERCSGIRWNHYKQPYKTGGNNIVFFGMTIDGYSAPTYSVEFNSNGGQGSMPNQTIPLDVATPLSINTFTKTDYIFSGWALMVGGDVVFSDGESVLNLAGENETITLYAVWIPKPLEIILQHNKTDNNHLDKEVETISTLYGVFRDEFTVTDPVIMLQGDIGMITGVNYFTIPVLGRSYFLTACDVVALNLIRIKGHVDVLSSFSESIRAQKVIIRRAESSGAYNLYLNDGSLRTYSNPYVLTEPFPAGFTSPSFVLAVAGSAST